MARFRVDAEYVARAYHEARGRLAPAFGWRPVPVPWAQVDKATKMLMIATVTDLLDKGVIERPDPPDASEAL